MSRRSVRGRAILLLAAFVSSGGVGGARRVSAQEPGVKSDILWSGDMNQGLNSHMFAVGPMRGRVAVVVDVGSRKAVRVDNVTSPEVFDRIETIRDTPASQTPKVMTPVLFGPDGERYVYLGKRSASWHVIVDGKVGPPTADSLLTIGRTILFSADGKRLAYVHSPSTATGEREQLPGRGSEPGPPAVQVILDGAPGPRYAGADQLAFSPDGARFGYVARLSPRDGAGAVLVLDGKEAGRCHNIRAFAFSADSKRYAYLCDENETQPFDRKVTRAVVDGKPAGSTYGEITQIVWSQRDAHIAYIGRKDAQNGTTTYEVVIDGVIKGSMGQVPSPKASAQHQDVVLSPDGRRYAYVDARPGGMAVVIDGKQSLEYSSVSSIAFSKDGKHAAAVVQATDGRWFVLFDGEELAPPGGLVASGRWFFVDLPGSRYAYPRKTAKGWELVAEGGDAPPTQIIELTGDLERLQPDGIHLAPNGRGYVLPKPGVTGALVVSGKELVGFRADDFARATGSNGGYADGRQSVVWSPDGAHLMMAVSSDGSAGPVRKGLFVDHAIMPSPDSQLGFAFPRFSGDGTHVAYAAPAKPKPGTSPMDRPWQVFLNGRPGPVVDELFSNMPESFAFLPNGHLQVLALSNKQLVRHVIDPGTSTIAEFAAHAKKAHTVAGAPGASPVAPASVDEKVKDPLGTAKDAIEGKVKGWFKKKKP